MAEASIEQLKELALLVRCGRLYDVQAWLAAGKPFDPARDNLVELLDAAAFCSKPEVVEYLLNFKPNVNAPTKDGRMFMDSYFRSLRWDVEPPLMRKDPDPTIRCIELLAKCSARLDGSHGNVATTL